MRKNKNNEWDKLNAIEKHEAGYLWDKTSSYKSSFEPDVDKAFARFQKATSEQASPAKVRSLSRYTFLRVAAAILFIVGAFGLWQHFNAKPPTEVFATTATPEEILLDDGTFVTLNKNSSLHYPAAFKGGKRVVELEGEGFFTVAKNPQKPFIIKTAKTQVRVLGTVFNVRAYRQEDFVEVAVKEGKVAFGTRNSANHLTLTADERGTYAINANKLIEEKSGLNEWGWKDRQLNFKAARMSEIKTILERFFGVKINLEGTFEGCTLTASFGKVKTIDDVLNGIAAGINVSIRKDSPNKRYTIIGHCR